MFFWSVPLCGSGLCLLAPTELLAVESDGLIPPAMLMETHRALTLMAWSVPAAHADTSATVDLQLWRRMPVRLDGI